METLITILYCIAFLLAIITLCACIYGTVLICSVTKDVVKEGYIKYIKNK